MHKILFIRRGSLIYLLFDDETPQSVESKSAIRGCIKVPASLGPTPDVKDWGCIPEGPMLGIQPEKACRYFEIGKNLCTFRCMVHPPQIMVHQSPLGLINHSYKLIGSDAPCLFEI